MDELLKFVTAVVLNSGIPVLLANLAKNFFPKMDGKTDKIVNVLVVGLFVFGWFYGEYYNPDFLFDVLPVVGAKAKEIVDMLNMIIALVVSLGLSPVIYSWVKNRVPLLGKSFSAKK